MRRTILLAIIACILGIVLLAALAFYIPNRLGKHTGSEASESFKGFEIVTEDPEPAQTQTPDKAGTQTRTASGQSSSRLDSASDSSLPGDTLPKDAGSGFRSTEQDSRNTGQDFRSTETEEDTPLTEETGSGTRSLQTVKKPARVDKHQVIWVGDSRTLGLRDALHRSERADEDLFVGKVGEGVRWFREEGMPELSDVIRQYPDLPVVMNLGVNDPQLVTEYIDAYHEVIRAHPGTKFYILSVNPLDEEFLIREGDVSDSVLDDINSLNVGRLNVKLMEEFGSRYLDSASFLKADGFETVDGLHYTTRTYLKIHDFVIDQLF